MSHEMPKAPKARAGFNAPVYRIMCAWCHKEMGPAPKLEGGLVSHSICPDCEKKMEDA